jgi:integrase
MGHKKIDEITRLDLVEFIKWIPKQKLPNATRTQNKTYTAKEVFNYVKKSLDYALNLGLIDFNPAYGIDPAAILPKAKKEKMKAVIDEKRIKEIYKIISGYKYKAGRYLMQFQALTALRDVGLYRLKWEYIDWDNEIIVFPPHTYKGNEEEYILPLTDTLLEILEYFKEVNGSSSYVFKEEEIKEESLANRLRIYYEDLNIKDHVPHGWRASFRSLTRKKKAANIDTAEYQLNHKLKFTSDSDDSYMREHLLDERRELLKWWEEFLTSDF